MDRVAQDTAQFSLLRSASHDGNDFITWKRWAQEQTGGATETTLRTAASDSRGLRD